MKNGALLLYEEDRVTLGLLNQAERCALLKAMLDFHFDGAEPQGCERSRWSLVWPMMRARIEENKRRWGVVQERNRKNGMKGGRPPKADEARSEKGVCGPVEGSKEKPNGNPEEPRETQWVNLGLPEKHKETQPEPSETQNNQTELNRTELNRTELNSSVGSKLPPSSSKRALSWDGERITGITDEDVARWGRTYKAVDVPDEIAKANQWLFDNPKRMKKDLRRYLGNWLAEANKKSCGGAGSFGGGFGRGSAAARASAAAEREEAAARRIGQTGGNFV